MVQQETLTESFRRRGNAADSASDMLKATERHLEDHANDGLRTLILTQKVLDPATGGLVECAAVLVRLLRARPPRHGTHAAGAPDQVPAGPVCGLRTATLRWRAAFSGSLQLGAAAGPEGAHRQDRPPLLGRGASGASGGRVPRVLLQWVFSAVEGAPQLRDHIRRVRHHPRGERGLVLRGLVVRHERQPGDAVLGPRPQEGPRDQRALLPLHGLPRPRSAGLLQRSGHQVGARGGADPPALLGRRDHWSARDGHGAHPLAGQAHGRPRVAVASQQLSDIAPIPR